MISPPGLSTRANSSSVASGSGTAVMTYCATTTSNDASGKPSACASITASASTLVELVLGDALVRLAQHRLGDSRRRRCDCCAHSRAAKCRCRRRRRGCARRCARPPRSRPCGRARTPRRTRSHRPAPSAHRPLRPCCLSISSAIAPLAYRRRRSYRTLTRQARATSRGARARHRRGDRAADEAAAEHARLALGRVVEHAGLAGRHAVLAVDQFDLDAARLPAAATPAAAAASSAP